MVIRVTFADWRIEHLEHAAVLSDACLLDMLVVRLCCGSEPGADAVGDLLRTQVDHGLALEALEVGGVAAVQGSGFDRLTP